MAIVVVHQQSLVTVLHEHRFREVVTPVSIKTVSTVPDAIRVVYETYANTPNNASHYATISINGRFVKSIKIGELDGFRQSG